jgi:hypothetical protein
MLRLLVVLLLLVNGAYFLWTQGHLAPLGLAPVNPSEPQHLAQQVKPESLTLMTADESKRLAAEAAAASVTECLTAGPLDEKLAAAVREAATQSLAAGQWSLDTLTVPGRWIIYMGRYADTDLLNRKKAELRARRIPFEPLTNPALEPGLSLGNFATQSAANEELTALSQRGVRTAKVVQERPDSKAYALKLPAVGEALRGKLEPLRDSLGGKGLRPC